MTTACVALCSTTLFGQKGNAPPHYDVINLGTLGGTYGEAYGVSNNGWISGVGTLAGDDIQHGIVWMQRGKQRLTKIDIGTLGGPNSLVYSNPTPTGQVAGKAELPDPDPLGEDFCHFGTHLACLPFLWSDVMTPLPTLGGNNGAAVAVNRRGQVVGGAETSTHDPTCKGAQVLQFEPALWEDGRVQALRTFPGDSSGVAVWINDSGQMIGSSGDCGTGTPTTSTHALLWQNGAGTPFELGTLGGTTGNRPQMINDRGDVVGFSNLPGDEITHAFLWQRRAMIDLGTLPGDLNSWGFCINEHGQVGGMSCDVDGNCRAFLWQHGTMTDLNALLPPTSSLYLLWADDINDRGEITGTAYDSATGDTPAFLAVPTKETGNDGSASSAAQLNPSRMVALSEEVRTLVRQRIGRR